MKKYIAECLGTFTLTLVVALSLAGAFPVSTPVLAGLTLGLFVYTIGALSGAHINPGVTIGAWSIGKMQPKEAVIYIVAQLVGAAVALGVMSGLLGGGAELTVSGDMTIWIAEALGMVFFTFGIASVVYKKTSEHMSGLVIGGSLLLGITIAVLLGSNGVLNPAVAIGIGSVNIAYLLAPVIGSIIGMQLYKYTAV